MPPRLSQSLRAPRAVARAAERAVGEHRVASLLAVGLAIALRSPALVVEPRLWGEEGAVYLQRALAPDWWAALWTAPGGYLQVVAGIAAVVSARIVGLAWAPVLTGAVSLGGQMLPAALILWSSSPPIREPRAKLLALLAVLFTVDSGELHLTTTNVHFHLGVVAFLILIEDPAPRVAAAACARRALLVLAALSGAPACFLSPLFCLRAWNSRRREEIVQAIVLVVATIAQGITLLAHLGAIHGPPDRVSGIALGLIPAILVGKTLLLPFLGHAAAVPWAAGVAAARAASPLVAALAAVGAALLWVGTLYWLARDLPRERAVLYLGSAAVLALVGSAFALDDRAQLLGPRTGARYFYIPSVILVLMIVEQLTAVSDRPMATESASAGSGVVRRRVLESLVGLSIFWGAITFHLTVHRRPEWPRWRDEVEAWRHDPSHRLAIWPPGWFIDAGPSRQPPLPTPPDQHDSNTPSPTSWPLIRANESIA